MLLMTKSPLDGVQERPGLPCNLMCGFNAVVERLILFFSSLFGAQVSASPKHLLTVLSKLSQILSSHVYKFPWV